MNRVIKRGRCIFSPDEPLYSSEPGKSADGELSGGLFLEQLPYNDTQILNRLQQIYQIMESPDDTNELEFSYQVGKIISQLEIYDQVWVARDLGNAVRI